MEDLAAILSRAASVEKCKEILYMLHKIISVINQKGGVSKATTALNLGADLTVSGKKVLLVDNDPQGNLTAALGFTPAEQKYTLANLLLSNIDYLDKNGISRVYSLCSCLLQRRLVISLSFIICCDIITAIMN